MAKRGSATRTEARKRAEQRNAAKLRAVQLLIEKSTDVFEVDSKIEGVAEREAEARKRAEEKYQRELDTITERFQDERKSLNDDRDSAVRSMLDIDGATTKDVAEAADLSQPEVKRIRAAAPKQSAPLDVDVVGDQVADY